MQHVQARLRAFSTRAEQKHAAGSRHKNKLLTERHQFQARSVYEVYYFRSWTCGLAWNSTGLSRAFDFFVHYAGFLFLLT